jgi:hypothetical protein
MQTTPPDPLDAGSDGPATSGSLRKRGVSVALFGVGLLMLAAAVWTISRHADTLEQARRAVLAASPALIAASLLLPIVNWLATSATIWVLLGRYGRVRAGEMAALIGAAWLLNMLPMRPGMVGRVAYHKKINGIRVRDSVRVIFAAMVCTGVALGSMLVMVALAAWLGNALGIACLVLGPPLALALLSAGVYARRTGGEHAWRYPAATACRYFDMLTWAVRYTIIFSLIGHPVGIVGGGAMTAVGQVAMLTPVQFGVREWAVGVANAAMGEARREWGGGGPGDAGPGRLDATRVGDATAPGLLADCCMRAAELLVVLPVGLVSAGWVVRRMRAAPKDAPGPAQESRGQPSMPGGDA